MRTGFTAIRLGLISFLLPFAFVYEPALLLMGSWTDIVLHVGSCALGIFFWGIAIEGYFQARVPGPARAALLLAGVLLIWPHVWVSFVGAVLGGVTILTTNRPRGRPN